MGFIQLIKNYVGNYFLSGELKGAKRDKKFLNINDAKKIGILFDATNKENFELVKKYIAYLKEMKKQVKAIGYYNLKDTPSMAYSKLEYDFFCKKDLTWYGVPNSIYVKNFIVDSYDILLDLNIDDHFPLHYIAAMSNATFKVGKKSEKNNSTFDLMIEYTSEKGLKYFLRNMDTYTQMINKKTETQPEPELK